MSVLKYSKLLLSCNLTITASRNAKQPRGYPDSNIHILTIPSDIICLFSPAERDVTAERVENQVRRPNTESATSRN